MERAGVYMSWGPISPEGGLGELLAPDAAAPWAIGQGAWGRRRPVKTGSAGQAFYLLIQE